jgi:hypothetical protein
MIGLKVIGVTWLLLTVIAVTALAISPTVEGQGTPAGGGIIGDMGQISMLDTDQQMLNLMRASSSPAMITMTRDNPMWTDADMIRLQEQNQAQLDRMIGRRAG